LSCHEETEQDQGEWAVRSGELIVGRVRYDQAVTLAQIQEKVVVEIDAPSAGDIRLVWESLDL